jgi:pimeloyl-ACP methyl ester carboxylesterase
MLILQIVAIILAAVMLARAFNLILLMRWYAKPKSPGEVIYLNDKRVYYTSKGKGSPTVVFESGLGSSSAEWWAIQEELSASSHVLTYDRAGYGWSESANGPRTSRQIALELKGLLEGLKIDPPYILVGHSQGGLYINHFCRLFPDVVGGVVLIDPVSPDDVRFRHELIPRVYRRSGVDKSTFLKVQGWFSGFGFLRVMKPFLLKSPHLAPYRLLPPKAFRAFWNNLISPRNPQTALNEYVQAHDPRNIVDLKNSGDFPPVPLRVLVHDRDKMRDAIVRHGDLSRDDADKVENLWQELMRGYGTLSPLSKVVAAETGSHLIHLTQPDFVIRNILEVLQEASRQ